MAVSSTKSATPRPRVVVSAVRSVSLIWTPLRDVAAASTFVRSASVVQAWRARLSSMLERTGRPTLAADRPSRTTRSSAARRSADRAVAVTGSESGSHHGAFSAGCHGTGRSATVDP